MPVIKWSTLEKLNDFNVLSLQKAIPSLRMDLLQHAAGDYLIDITDDEKRALDALINPHFKKTSALLQSFDTLYQSYDLLKNTPFRQSRNAFGFTASMMGLVNAGLSITSLSAIATSCLVFLPAIVAGVYVYYRGRREENQINEDHEATIFDEKVNVTLVLIEISQLKKEISETEEQDCKIQPETPIDTKSSEPPYKKIKPYNEKRSTVGNSISHCLVPLSATSGMVLSFLKFGLLAKLVAISGPIGWAIAMGAGIFVGAYFSYKRYHNLTCKKAFEEQKHAFENQKKELEGKKERLQKQKDRLLTQKCEFLSAAQQVDRPENTRTITPVSVTIPGALFRSNSTPNLALEEPKKIRRCQSAPSIYSIGLGN